MKRLFDKRKLQLEKRAQMGIYHINNVSSKEVENAGVTKREFEMIKKLMDLDPEIFVQRYHVIVKSSTPYIFSVDLSKYDGKKIPQECKEILFRPPKLEKLRERYWAIASSFDIEETKKEEERWKLKWSVRRLHKENKDDYLLLDKIIAVLDDLAQRDYLEKKHIAEEKAKTNW